ncbi:aldo/keto reductase [Rothia sp. ZJ1223]|nr:aldo/keto reductase [Rothia sp. ZJ1223]
MRIADLTDTQIQQLYSTARAQGINFFDHADLYGFNSKAASGAYHYCEQRFGAALNLSNSEREDIILQTKTGIVIGEKTYYDSSYERIMGSVDRSLKALNTDYLDILLLHRPDALIEPNEVARAFDELETSGKVRAFGVSNYTPRQIEHLKTSVTQPITVNQLQLSMVHASIITQGLASNIESSENSLTRDGGGVLDYCRREGIALQAWSPFQAGQQQGLIFDRDKHPQLKETLDAIAQELNTTPVAVATAWITRHPANIQVVAGTTNTQRLEEIARGAELTLTRQQWYELTVAAGHLLP